MVIIMDNDAYACGRGTQLVGAHQKIWKNNSPPPKALMLFIGGKGNSQPHQQRNVVFFSPSTDSWSV